MNHHSYVCKCSRYMPFNVEKLHFTNFLTPVNILQKSVIYARDRVSSTNFCQPNFEDDFNRNINLNAKLY